MVKIGGSPTQRGRLVPLDLPIEQENVHPQNLWHGGWFICHVAPTQPKWFLIKQAGSSIKLSEARERESPAFALCSGSFVAVGYGVGRPRMHASIAHYVTRSHATPLVSLEPRTRQIPCQPCASQTLTDLHLLNSSTDALLRAAFPFACHSHHFPPSNFSHRHQPQPAKHMT